MNRIALVVVTPLEASPQDSLMFRDHLEIAIAAGAFGKSGLNTIARQAAVSMESKGKRIQLRVDVDADSCSLEQLEGLFIGDRGPSHITLGWESGLSHADGHRPGVNPGHEVLQSHAGSIGVEATPADTLEVVFENDVDTDARTQICELLDSLEHVFGFGAQPGFSRGGNCAIGATQLIWLGRRTLHYWVDGVASGADWWLAVRNVVARSGFGGVLAHAPKARSVASKFTAAARQEARARLS